MSLSLLQGYSSQEEEDERFSNDSSLSDEEEEDGAIRNPHTGQKSLDPPKPSANSLLPSAFDAFSEIAGPPEFLNNFVPEKAPAKVADHRGRNGRRRWKEKKDLPAGVVVEAKPQLVAIRDQVRSDVGRSLPPPSSMGPPGDGKRVLSAANPEPKDAAELLRMCIHCGIPKTYSNSRGMVCPVCGDRPPDPNKELEKKKGSTIKDKEKNKRMKGQSSHATWKSETEMQLRQQFD